MISVSKRSTVGRAVFGEVVVAEDLGRMLPVGRPRVKVRPEDVRDLRSKGVSWRKIGNRLKIGTATAMRLFKSIETVPPAMSYSGGFR